MRFSLPKPPTTNSYYRITSRGKFASMYISKEGKDWQLEATAALRRQYRGKPIVDPCEIWINVFTSTRRDVDGSIKPVLDLLQSARVIENDNLFYALHTTREKCKKGEDRVEIEILGY